MEKSIPLENKKTAKDYLLIITMGAAGIAGVIGVTHPDVYSRLRLKPKEKVGLVTPATCIDGFASYAGIYGTEPDISGILPLLFPVGRDDEIYREIRREQDTLYMSVALDEHGNILGYHIGLGCSGERHSNITTNK